MDFKTLGLINIELVGLKGNSAEFFINLAGLSPYFAEFFHFRQTKEAAQKYYTFGRLLLLPIVTIIQPSNPALIALQNAPTYLHHDSVNNRLISFSIYRPYAQP